METTKQRVERRGFAAKRWHGQAAVSAVDVADYLFAAQNGLPLSERSRAEEDLAAFARAWVEGDPDAVRLAGVFGATQGSPPPQVAGGVWGETQAGGRRYSGPGWSWETEAPDERSPDPDGQGRWLYLNHRTAYLCVALVESRSLEETRERGRELAAILRGHGGA